MAKIGTCSRRCKGKRISAFRSCVRSCMKGAKVRKRRRRRR